MPDKYVSKDNLEEILSQYSTSVLSKINEGSAYEAYKNGLLSTENNGNLVVN